MNLSEEHDWRYFIYADTSSMRRWVGRKIRQGKIAKGDRVWCSDCACWVYRFKPAQKSNREVCEEVRRECNKLTRQERDALYAKAMELIQE